VLCVTTKSGARLVDMATDFDRNRNAMIAGGNTETLLLFSTVT